MLVHSYSNVRLFTTHSARLPLRRRECTHSIGRGAGRGGFLRNPGIRSGLPATVSSLAVVLGVRRGVAMPSGGVRPDDRAAPGPTHTSSAHAEALSSKVPWDAGEGWRAAGPAVAAVPGSLTGSVSAPAAGFPSVLQICGGGGTEGCPLKTTVTLGQSS